MAKSTFVSATSVAQSVLYLGTVTRHPIAAAPLKKNMGAYMCVHQADICLTSHEIRPRARSAVEECSFGIRTLHRCQSVIPDIDRS